MRTLPLLSNVAVWSMRPVQTLSVSHPYAYEPRGSMPVDAQLKVVKGHGCVDVCPPRPRKAAIKLPRLPANVPTLANPPASALPDLVPLPSYDDYFDRRV